MAVFYRSPRDVTRPVAECNVVYWCTPVLRIECTVSEFSRKVDRGSRRAGGICVTSWKNLRLRQAKDRNSESQKLWRLVVRFCCLRYSRCFCFHNEFFNFRKGTAKHGKPYSDAQRWMNGCLSALTFVSGGGMRHLD